MLQNLFRTKNLESLQEEVSHNDETGLKRSLGALDLVSLGVGAVIGAGIFVTTGIAAAGSEGYIGAGPAVSLSFILVSIACMFCALCYAEFASMIPVSGSAYTYSYATMGELAAWIIGWDLILEYLVGNVAVAISWSGYFVALFKSMGVDIPVWLSTATQTASPQVLAAAPHLFGIPIVFNLPAILVVALLTAVLVKGVKESANFNSFIVILKILIIFFVLAVGAFYIDPENWHPFMPNGWAGVQAGAAVVFFAYIGFDAVSTAAEETENPGRNMPIGVIGSLVICTILYVAVSLVLTGMLSYTELGVAEPMVKAFQVLNMPWAVIIIAAGALISMTAVLLVFQLAQPRIFFSMARDGLFPKYFCKVHPIYRTPHVTTIGCGVIVALASGFADMNMVIELCNIGTLFAFIIVCAGIIIMRHTNPEAKRPFKVPFCPVVPLLGIASCLYLCCAMPVMTWIRFISWLLIGVVIYGLYGYKHSILNSQKTAEPQAIADPSDKVE